MTPIDPDPAKPGRDDMDDDLTSPSRLDSGDDWDDDTPLTDTMDPDRADKIDSIMQSFCEALDSKLVLVKKEKPSSAKIDKDGSRVTVKEEKEDADVDDGKASPTASFELKKESEADAAPEPSTSSTAAKGLPLLQRLKKSVAVTTSSGPGSSSGPGAHRIRAAFRLAPRHGAPSVVSEAAVSGPSSSAAPPPPSSGPPAPTASAAPTPSAIPTATPTSSPSASTQPPPPLPTVTPSSQHPVYSHFIHIPDAAAFTSPPSHLQHAPAFGAAARNLQQAPTRSPIQSRGEPQTLRPRQSPNASPAAFFHSSSRSLAPQDQGWCEPFDGSPPPPLQYWQATPTQPITDLGNQGPFGGAFGGPEFGTRGLDQAGVPSPNFQAPFNSPPDSLRPPGAPPSGELYPLPVPEPGGSRRQYRFGSPPSIREQESNGNHSRKSSAVSHSVAPASSPASAAAQPAIDKAPDRDGRRKRQKAATEDTTPKTRNKKFACPYYKRNRKKYCKWTSCPGPGWEEVHRVKTHLYRRHGRPPQCPRCWAVFSTDDDLQVHQQQDPPCETSHNVGLVEGYSREQEKRLRSRKKAQPCMTDEDKWREIYMILFPDDDQDSIPSPYYDDMDINEREEGGGGAETALEDYATFVRREMPTLVRRELEVLFEDEFKDIDERLRPRVAKIVLELQPKLLNLYKQSQLPLSEYGPQNLDHIAPGQTPASNSETGIASTVSPASGTDTSSTPGVVAGLKSDSGNAVNAGSEILPYLDAAAVGFDPNNLETNFAWDETQYQFHNPSTDATQYYGITAADGAGALGGGLDWSYEFDQLLNPALFVPHSDTMLMQVQGEVNEGAKRKYDGN
ncbi:hypothetical protein QBC37DRAFT_430117 [Rhypophila decipiens]|uniref:C2H2-type domain-containing protein n=1 Tax=Rhypophila decipiens TaxID=261697 RepID=A0AAN6Y3U2_9PEZI|nr:hypothetical protein QBC37DRAFT_430117 [Rhypophila decipiens]